MEYTIPVFTTLPLNSPDDPVITPRELKRELAHGRMTQEQVDSELGIVLQHLTYQRTRQARLEQEMRDMTRAYQKRLHEIGEEIGQAQREIDELIIIRRRLYDRRHHYRKKEDGREHPPENGEG